MPMLFVTLGFPGSGKTYFARRFARDFKLVHLNNDSIRSDMFKKPKYTPAESKTLFENMERLTGEYLGQGKSVIYDANVTKRIFRSKLQQIAKENKSGFLVLYFQTPDDIAVKRVEGRKTLKPGSRNKSQVYLDNKILFAIKKSIEPPGKKEPYVVIAGAEKYKDQIRHLSGFLPNK